MFTAQQLNVIKYCAEECERQGSGEKSVYDMLNAWDHVTNYLSQGQELDISIIEDIGKLVEPSDNKDGFRTVPIGVSDGFNWIEKSEWREVPRLLTLLIESYYEGNLWPPTIGTNIKAKSAEDVFYYEYENIHPFRDGNGRTGKILYNYLKGTLDNPVLPPNFWGSSNP